MKITDMKATAYSYPVKERYGNGLRWNTARTMVLVQVETDDGIIGYGESDCAGGPAEVTVSVIEKELKPKLLGLDPVCVERVWQKLYQDTFIHGRRGTVIACMSGIDIALWDIVGKSLHTPVYKLLGGARDRVRAYASGGFYREGKPPAYYGEEAAKEREKGFTAFKMKIGRYTQIQDLERVRAVREAVGADAMLMVDANSAYLPKQAIQMARRLEEYQIAWFEEPVSVDQIESSAMVAARTSIPVAGYETQHTRYGFRDLIDAKAIDVAQPDVIRSGGFTECRKIAAYASAHGIPCTAHIFSSGLSLAANLHFVASIDNGFLLECDQNENPLRTELFTEEIVKLDQEGFVMAPQGPGLGVEINFDAIAAYKLG